MNTDTHTDGKSAILAALAAWINQRPGLQYGNYGDPNAYQAEYRSIRKDGAQAHLLLSAVATSPITAEELIEAFSAFSGRLTWNGTELDYVTGQYWPTEYRRAACAVLAQALWSHYREEFCKNKKPSESDGTAIRRKFRIWFGRTIQSRWFD